MKQLTQSTKFKKDLERIKKRGKDREKLLTILEILKNGQEIPKEYGDHPLVGNWVGYRDLHIESDWLLIYEVTEDEVYLARTGTHTDLF